MITSAKEALELTEKAIEEANRKTRRLDEEAEEKARKLLYVVDEAILVAAARCKYSILMTQKDLIGDSVFELSEDERQRVNEVVLPYIVKSLKELGFEAVIGGLDHDIAVSWGPKKDDRLPMDNFYEGDKWGKPLTKRW